MVRIVNPFRGTDPIAETISRLGQNMFGGTLDRDIKTEQLVAAQRQNTETGNLMDLFANGGAFGAIKSPIGQAMALGSGLKPGDAGGFALLDSGLNFGAADPRTQNAQVASGQSYDNTAAAVNAKLAETMRNNDMASADRRYSVDNALVEAIRGGKPVYVPNSEAAGMQPVLSDTDVKGTFAQNNFGTMGDLPPAEQAYLGADVATGGKTPRNYVAPDGKVAITYDGVTDAQTGQPLTPGGYIAGVEGAAKDAGISPTNAVTTDLQSNVVASDAFIQSIDAMLSLTDNPSNFGLPGAVKSVGQEIGQGAGAVLNMFGGEPGVQQAVGQARAELDKSGLSGLIPELYDPALPAIQMLGGVLVYQGASVLAGQENRSISDKDTTMMRQILGDPQGLFESAQSIKTKLTIAKAMAENHRMMAQQYLKNGMEVPPGLEEAALAQAIQQVTAQQGQPNLPAPPAEGGVGGDTADEAQEGDDVQGPDGRMYKVINGQLVPQ